MWKSDKNIFLVVELIKCLRFEMRCNMNKRSLSDRYMDLRIEKGLSQTELAKVLGCNKQYISKFEDGTRSLSMSMLVKYADFFDVSTDYLLGRTDIKTANIAVKEICDYTGLNEEAIKRLYGLQHLSKGDLKNWIKVINLLILDGDLDGVRLDGEYGILPTLYEYFFAEYEIPINQTDIDSDDLNTCPANDYLIYRIKGTNNNTMTYANVLQEINLVHAQQRLIKIKGKLGVHGLKSVFTPEKKEKDE